MRQTGCGKSDLCPGVLAGHQEETAVQDDPPALEEWRSLYEAAIRVKKLAPWEWMSEETLFGVQNPETDELGFVSVMGMLGEHYSLAVYLGPEGLYGFWEVEEAGPLGSPERILEVPQFQASFENRDQLHNQDRKIIKALGLKFRGRYAWPLFRSYRPGFFPWFLEAAEVRFLTCALEQALDVLPRFRDHPALLEPPDEESYLVRVPHPQDGDLVWKDHILRVPPPELVPIPIAMDVDLLETLKGRPRGQLEIEVDFFMFPGPIGEGRERPIFAYVLMAVEAQSGMVLGTEMLRVETSLEEMWGQIPLNVANHLAMLGATPGKISVRSALLLQVLEPLAQELRFELEQSHSLPSLDEAKAFLLDRFL
jgi:hypothetical protein